MSTQEQEQVGSDRLLETKALFPLPPVFRQVEDNLWAFLDERVEPSAEDGIVGLEDAAPADEAAIMQEELDRIFGPDNAEGAEQIAGLVLWIRNMEQAAGNETALAKPFEEEAQRHKRRARTLENRVRWARERLALVVATQAGGRFDAGLHKVHVRETPSAQVAGTCKVHPVEHYEENGCQGWEPTEQLPVTFARVKVEPRLQDLRKWLLAEEEAGRPWPVWARVVRRLSAVIR